MNIYITDLEASKAAQGLCDNHIKEYPEKILTLCKNALAIEYVTGLHVEWCRTSKQNLEWMIQFGIAICNIYTAIWMKNHPLKTDFQKLLKSLEKSKKFPSLGITRRPMNFAKFAKLSYINANREAYKEKFGEPYYSPCRIKPSWIN